jgi:16S rRNA (uracil1498-N3)-methyltransferase
LFQSIPNKIDKIESIIKNGTQIWITNFLFFKSERSQKLNISKKKEERLNKIILEASEQSERNIIPKLIIWDKIDFRNLEWQNLFFHTKNNNSQLLKDVKIKHLWQINLFVWPEWGFSKSEIDEFEVNDFTRIYLWDRILRTELAWVSSAFSIIQNNI